MYLGLKIRLYPNKEQRRIIDLHIIGSRFVYNYFVNYAKENNVYDVEVWEKELQRLISNSANEEIKSCDYYLLLNQLSILKMAFDNFFKGVKEEPRFKTKNAIVSAFKIQNRKDNVKIENNRIIIDFLGSIKARFSKDISGCKIYSAVIKRTINNIYEASVLYNAFVPYLKKTYRKVGIDIGVRKLITTSDKEFIIPNNNLSTIEKSITQLQKLLSTKEKGSNNYLKVKNRIARMYVYRSNYIKDILNKATTNLVNEYDVIFMEDLSIQDLVKQQEKKVIRRRILISSLNLIKEMLSYKCKMYGKKLVFIDRFFPSSKICSECGFRHDPKDSEKFVCPVCGLTIDRDYNAAKNIYKYGISRFRE